MPAVARREPMMRELAKWALVCTGALVGSGLVGIACADFSDAAIPPCDQESGMVQDHATCLPEQFGVRLHHYDAGLFESGTGR